MSRISFRDTILDRMFPEEEEDKKGDDVALLCGLEKIKYPCLIANLLLNGIGWGVLLVLAITGDIHNDQSGCYDGDSNCFCEDASIERFVAQPANTWSNLGFTIGGLFIAWAVDTKRFPTNDNWENNLNQITYHPWYPFSYSLLLSNLSYSSGYFHAGFTNWGHALDAGSILALLFWFWYYSLIKLVLMCTGWSLRKMRIGLMVHSILTIITFIMLYALVFSGGVIKSFTTGIFFEYVLMSVGGFVLIEIFVRFGYEYCLHKERMSKASLGVLASLFLIAAFACQRLSDGVEGACFPESFFQFHGLWHFLSAIGLSILFFFFLSEKFLSQRRNGRSHNNTIIQNSESLKRMISREFGDNSLRTKGIAEMDEREVDLEEAAE
mmetsp:Transcript_4890/g.7067  ORF Transcript_4890/g.7067 Transcript_4890/m.7067 type:complete len:381 (+) Transcript_4890:198-1340(+)|eukprot:CAMPEP_0194212094 /NCGR_PEP_ID=MMETSP0156-20130528/11727_1 /TAXON_ID=33649 /ORGANISM="Thalassionema nitzschioides, Strain L26-B" /LENGTH=380 /DNA_ID=CAMNT_0038939831 /DNA_START=55 /DNA_END=1197 /DNA_ORIENTATION=-